MVLLTNPKNYFITKTNMKNKKILMVVAGLLVVGGIVAVTVLNGNGKNLKGDLGSSTSTPNQQDSTGGSSTSSSPSPQQGTPSDQPAPNGDQPPVPQLAPTTQPTFSVAAQTPVGESTPALQKDIFYFNVTAKNNPEDPSENKVILNTINITTATTNNLLVQNVKIYESYHDLDQNFVTNCVGSGSYWSCQVNTQSGNNQIIENTTRTYIVRADINAKPGISTLFTSIRSLGNANTAGDVTWTDNTTGTTYNWVDQNPSSVVPATPLVYKVGPLASPTFSVAYQTPVGKSTAALQKDIFYFNVTAKNTTEEDPAENYVKLFKIRLTTATTGVKVQNVKIYPSDHDLDQNFVTNCMGSGSLWDCQMNTQSGSNLVNENTTKTYIVRADVSAPLGGTLLTSIASLGNSNTPGDVTWIDVNDYNQSYNWIDQNPSSVVPASPLTYESQGILKPIPQGGSLTQPVKKVPLPPLNVRFLPKK